VWGTDSARLILPVHVKCRKTFARSPTVIVFTSWFSWVVHNSCRKMLARVAWAFFALGCVSGPSTVAAQSTAYQFTMGVTSPTPVPGQPFTITWTGGETTETVYIVLNGYFPPLTTQNIIYTTTDILCKSSLSGGLTFPS
jgi:hypothetical protein